MTDAEKKLQEDLATLEAKYKGLLVVNRDLTRGLVSFQASKKAASYRWYKFKEGYSSTLVAYYLDTLGIKKGKVLDPNFHDFR